MDRPAARLDGEVDNGGRSAKRRGDLVLHAEEDHRPTFVKHGVELAVAVLEARGFRPEDFAANHPAGALGRRLLLRVEDVIDLTALHDPDILLGWCRGLALQDGQMWVGFSRIRPTRFRENVGWIMSGFKRAMPTHIGLYDLKARRCVREIDLEPLGLGAVYSVFPAFHGE